MLTAEELRELLAYDLATGVFTWRRDVHHVKTGQKAGGKNLEGYWVITVNRRGYRAHRLAWLHVYGVWPRAEIDHINSVRDDNRIANLREATRAENNRNRKKQHNGRCSLKGIYLAKGRFRAQIRAHGKTTHIGYYDTEEEAHAAYVAAAEKEFGAFARAE